MENNFPHSLEEVCQKCRFSKNCKRQKSLKRIKSVIDSIYNGKITVTVEKNDCDSIHKNYDTTVILGMIMSHTYEGLGLPIPKTEGGMFL